MFSREFCEISKNTFFIEQLRTTASLTTLLAVFRSFVARRCEKAPWFTKFYDLLQFNFFMCQQRLINGLGYWWKWKYHETTLSAVKTINISLKRGPLCKFQWEKKEYFQTSCSQYSYSWSPNTSSTSQLPIARIFYNDKSVFPATIVCFAEERKFSGLAFLNSVVFSKHWDHIWFYSRYSKFSKLCLSESKEC